MHLLTLIKQQSHPHVSPSCLTLNQLCPISPCCSLLGDLVFSVEATPTGYTQFTYVIKGTGPQSIVFFKSCHHGAIDL